MDKFTVFLPHITAVLLILLYFGFTMVWMIITVILTFKLFHRKGIRLVYVWKMTSRTWEKIIFSAMGIIAGVFIVFFMVPWLFAGYLKGKPDDNWQKKMKETKTAIIFGFGYGIENGHMTPEASNQFLYDLACKQMKAQYFIVQKGVYAAALKDSMRIHSEHTCLISMHPTDRDKDINTFVASKYALVQMEKLGQSKAVVYAHSLQIRRAINDLRRVAGFNPKWKHFNFISPDIPDTPFPKKTAQWRTRSKIIYRAIELYYSRVRDAWYPM